MGHSIKLSATAARGLLAMMRRRLEKELRGRYVRSLETLLMTLPAMFVLRYSTNTSGEVIQRVTTPRAYLPQSSFFSLLPIIARSPRLAVVLCRLEPPSDRIKAGERGEGHDGTKVVKYFEHLDFLQDVGCCGGDNIDDIAVSIACRCR